MRLTDLLERKSSNNITATTLNLIQCLKVPVTKTSLIETLENHHSFPSLLSISDCLDKVNVANVALRIDKEKLEDLPRPFVAHTNKGRGNFMLITSVDGDTVTYLNDLGRPMVRGKSEFLRKWDNIVLLVEKDSFSGDPDYKSNRRKERFKTSGIPFVVTTTIILSLVAIFLNARLAVSSSILIIAKLIGTMVSVLLLWFEIDKENPTLKNICTSGRKTDCTAVLGSKQSKLFKIISWSEIGFFYFAGGLLFSLIGSSQSVFGILSWMNLVAIPYTIFSIYYQWKVVKQWCPLCLVIQALLIVEFLSSIGGAWLRMDLLLNAGDQLFIFLICYLLPVFFWIATKPVYKLAQASANFKIELSRLKNNKDVLNVLLQKETRLNDSPGGLGVILGNDNAENVIIKVCNPFCKPCAESHPAIDNLLEASDNLKVQILFTGAKDDPNALKQVVIKHLMSLYKTHGKEKMKAILDDWYVHTNRNYIQFTNKYPLQEGFEEESSSFDAMNEWCDRNDISYTPTFFLNGHRLPDLYTIKELKSVV